MSLFDPMDGKSNSLLELLVPHLQTALKLRSRLVSLEAMRSFSEVCLDAMAIAALLVTGEGKVIHANRYVIEMIGQSVFVVNGKLTFTLSVERSRLEALLQVATATQSIGSPGGVMKISRTGAGDLLLTVIPVPENNVVISGKRCAVVFISDPSAAPFSRADVMRPLYNLTPTEARISDLLLKGLDLRESSDHLRLTLETVRFHVKAILRKTGTRKQSELLKLMLTLLVKL